MAFKLSAEKNINRNRLKKKNNNSSDQKKNVRISRRIH